MHLTQIEQEKLMLHYAGALAKERQKRGVKLNYPEAVALICSELMEGARDGKSLAELNKYGTEILHKSDCMDGVPEMIHDIQVEATFTDGTKMVSIHDPIK